MNKRKGNKCDWCLLVDGSVVERICAKPASEFEYRQLCNGHIKELKETRIKSTNLTHMI